MRGQQSALPTLPTDLHVLIFALLEPLDILQIRQTCKALRSATLHRIVWIEALRKICLRNNIYMPTFPISRMRLSELEHAALVPQKWLRMCHSSTPMHGTQPPTPLLSPNPTRTSESTKRGSKPTVPPQYIARRLHCPKSMIKDSMLEPEPLGIFNGFYLVPGGRFLVTFSRNWFAVWDLSINPGRDTILDFQPLDAVIVRLTGMDLVHPTPDGLGLRIFASVVEQVVYKDEVHEVTAALIYEIYPQSNNPHLEVIARLDPALFAREIAFYSLSADRFIFMHGYVLKFWDYKLDTWASWTVEHEYDQIVVGENSIMLLYNGGVDVWPIPVMTPLSSSKGQTITSAIPPPIVKPILSLSYPSPVESTSWCEGPCDWFSGTSQPYIYDLVFWDTATRSADLRRYEILLAPNLKSGELVERRRFGLVGNPNKRGVGMAHESWVNGSWVEAGSSTASGENTNSAPQQDGNVDVDGAGEAERDADESELESDNGYLVIRPSMFLDDELATIVFDSRDNSVQVHLCSTLPGPEPATEGSSLPLSPHASRTLISGILKSRPPLGIGFCPLSARLVYVDDDHRICIVDYTPKPAGSGVTWLDMASGGKEEIVHDAVLEVCDSQLGRKVRALSV